MRLWSDYSPALSEQNCTLRKSSRGAKTGQPRATRPQTAVRRHWPQRVRYQTGSPSPSFQNRRSLSACASCRRARPKTARAGRGVMTLPRRRFLSLTAGAVALSAASRMARAQAYPSRPARIIVGFPPGGATDIQARLMGQWLTQRLTQQFIIENKPGVSGNVGTELVAKAPADGYTLLQVVTPNAIN